MIAKSPMSQADAAAEVLLESGRPMHRREITEEILRRGLDVWASGGPGRTPWESVGRAITQEIVQLGQRSRFEYERKGSGTYKFRVRPPESESKETESLGHTIRVTLDSATLAGLDRECLERKIDRQEFVRRALERQLWQLEIKRAEGQWLRSYTDRTEDDEEMAVVRSPKHVPEPWEPRR
jgi:hypothetical protein